MKPLVLIILDGWGHCENSAHNGIAQAKKPNFDKYWNEYPHTLIDGSGHAVGLPEGIMGNSEVGHMNLGAGRIVFSGLSQIYKSIEDKTFFRNPALLSACEAAKKNNSKLHLMGLLSDGAVHSHQDHLYALLDLAKQQGIKEVFIHCFMDGRDTPPQDGIKYMSQLQDVIAQKGIGKIASVCGRYYAMDRDKRWDRVKLAYDVLTGTNPQGDSDPIKIIQKSYDTGKVDEFILPQCVLNSSGEPIGAMSNNDAVIFFNFRPDRAREISQALTEKNFSDFVREKNPHLSSFVGMSVYDASFNIPAAFSPSYPQRILGEIVSENGLKQLRIAETEKYAHVTYFFNGGQDKTFPGEERILVPSAKEVPTYDHKPEMSAPMITEKVLAEIAADKFNVIVMNYANADMVGHTAIPKAIIPAVETIDSSLGKVIPAVLAKGGTVLITADHGNAEKMLDEKGNPHTAHTTNLVPFMLISNEYQKSQLQKSGGRLCDVAPTMLKILGIDQPTEMTGNSLLTSL